MLGPLLYLGTLIALTSAISETFTENQEFPINSCVITYYQQSYSKLQVNLTDNNIVICFDDFYNPEKSQDFIIGPKPSNGQVNFTLLQQPQTSESTIQQNVPTISNPMTCSIRFDYEVDGNKVALILFSFGSESALEISSETSSQSCDVMVSGGLVETLSADSLQPSTYTDISGCRMPGGGIKPEESINNPETCTTISCSILRSLTINTCGEQEQCNGKNVCLLPNTCTVTGPTIIDIHGTYNTVGDRCVYSLVSDKDCQIDGMFVDRRRQDVYFLDRMKMRCDNTEVEMGQGPEVVVNNSSIILNNTVIEINGLQLYEDQTGTHVRKTLAGRQIYIFFDGTMAQIHIEGALGSSLGGLCGNSSNISSAKLTSKSSPGCEIQYTEPADNTINCAIMTERCSILRQEPFASFNTQVDPAPYITACSETLCRYPAVDGLRCQFLWAYARACILLNNTLEDWWSKAACSPRDVLCQDKVCSEHEFCSIKYSGQPDCLCRAIFASSYRESSTLANPTICSKNSASISLVGCLLAEKNIDYSLLHLNDDTCKGKLDPDTGMVTFSFNTSDSCGSIVTLKDNYVMYKNTIRALNNTPSVIYRRDQFQIDFSCIYSQSKAKAVNFKIKDSSVVQEMSSEMLNYTVALKPYLDKEHTLPVTDLSDLSLDQRLYIDVETEGLNSDTIAVVIDSCWGTNDISFSSTPKHDLIYNGCPNPEDPTVSVMANGEGTSCSFCFNMFQFIGHSGDVYLHCKLRLCLKNDNNCIPDCSGTARRRRSADPSSESKASAIVTMAWSN